jgi:hypothetical protein
MEQPFDLRGVSAQSLGKLAALEPRLQGLADSLGRQVLAALLGINADDIAPMIAGRRAIPRETGRRILDIDYLLARALYVFGSAQVVVDWLDGIEPTFGYGQPIVMLAKRGVAPLLEVLERIEAGAYS